MGFEVGESSLMSILFVKVVCHSVLRINSKAFSGCSLSLDKTFQEFQWFLKMEASTRHSL